MMSTRKSKGYQKMAISVYEQLNSMGINVDRATLQQVSQNILRRAEQKNRQYEVSTAQRFSRQNLGVDLYNGKVDVNLAKQIALNNSGLQITLSQDTVAKINYLNSMAAQNLGKGTEAKFSMAITDMSAEKQVTPVDKGVKIVSNETAKDKNGSNPFYNGELLMDDKKAGDEKTDNKSTIVGSVFA